MPAARLRSVAWAGALVLLALLQLQPPAGAEPYAPWRPLRCTRYDTSITVLDDGSLAVVEIFTLLFPDGDASRSGWLELPTGRSNGIDRVEVLELREDGAIPFRPVPPIKFSGYTPGLFTATERTNRLRVDFAFSPSEDVERTFELKYRVRQALELTGDGVNRGFRLRWTAIRRDLTDLVPVMGATVTVLLPEPVAPTRLTADGDANGVAALGSAPRRLYAWRIPLLPTWGEFELDLGWPSARAVAATAPAWQLEEERRNEARANLWRFIVVLGIVVVPAGVVGLPFVWWRFGRDPAVELPEGRVTEPPDDLTPGLVGALLHRRVPRHVHVAALIELCRRDVIAVWESGKDQWVLELRQPDAPLSPYEARLVHAAFPDGRPGETTDLFEAGWLLGRASDGLERQILEDLTEQGYFPSSPRSVRLAWGLAGLAVMIAGGIPAVALVDHTGTPAWVLLAGSQLLGWGLAAMGFLVPRRSARGAAARARWEAYATEIRWENPRPGEGATSRFDRELPFAIAFGCGASFVDRFAQVDTATPAWYVALGSLLDAPDEALRSADGHLMAGPITGAPLAYTADGLCRFLAKADDLFIRRTRI